MMVFNSYIKSKFINLLICFQFFAFLSCNVCIDAKKSTDNLSLIEQIGSKNLALTTNCPAEGKCTIRINKNKSIVLKSVNNYVLYNLVPDNNKTTIEFQYSANQEDAAIDGGYREVVIFEISNDVKEIKLKDLDLQQSKMIYARYCNCRGKAGIFKVINGDLELTANLEEIDFSLNFALDKNPPLIASIYVQKNSIK